MAIVQDPVCGMQVDTDTTPVTESYRGTTYFFCSSECHRTFKATPARYVI